MRDIVIGFVHLIVTLVRLARPGGLRSVVAESVLVNRLDHFFQPERQLVARADDHPLSRSRMCFPKTS